MFKKAFEDWCRDNEKRETLENSILFGGLLLIDLSNRLEAAQPRVQPDGAGTPPESGEYFVEYIESNIVRLTPRR